MLGLNWYVNVNYHTNNAAKIWITGLVGEDLDPKLKGLTPPIHVHYKIYLERKGSDGGNVRSVIEKYVLDAFKAHGMIPDDNFEMVVSDSSEYHLDRENSRAEITISEITKNGNDAQTEINF